MIAATCRRCQSTNLRKNGRTTSGHQKVHCKDGHCYGTRATQTAVRAQRREVAAQLATERRSQRAIARTLKMSRRTVARVLKKKLDTDGALTAAARRPTDSRNR